MLHNFELISVPPCRLGMALVVWGGNGEWTAASLSRRDLSLIRLE